MDYLRQALNVKLVHRDADEYRRLLEPGKF
jgi:hypothetical protein